MNNMELPSVKYIPQSETLYACQWTRVLFELTRSEEAVTPFVLVNINCPSPGVEVDNDLLQRDLDLGPGETYRVTLLVRVNKPMSLPVDQFVVQYKSDGTWSQSFRCPAGLLNFHSSPRKEIHTIVEPLCRYDDGTKILFTFRHTGTTPFKDVHISFAPEEAVVAAKSLRRRSFRPGEEAQLEVVVRPGPLDVMLQAAAGGKRTTEKITHTITPISTDKGNRLFRFLEPRRVSSDSVTVQQGEEEGAEVVAAQHGSYSVHGQQAYRITIQPQRPDVERINIRNVPQKIAVRKEQHNSVTNTWSFLVEFIPNNLFSEPECLYYDVETANDKMTGEVHLLIRPPSRRYLFFALTAGLALTVRGGMGLVSMFHGLSEPSERIIMDLISSPGFSVNFFSLLIIPFLLLVLPILDKVWIQFSTGE